MIFVIGIFIIFVKEQQKQRNKVIKLIQDRNYYHGKIHDDTVTLICMLQNNAVNGMFLKLTNQHNFSLYFHLENPQNLVDYFPFFSKNLWRNSSAHEIYIAHTIVTFLIILILLIILIKIQKISKKN